MKYWTHATMLVVFAGCGFLRPPPDVIAERFWDAAMDRDLERAAEYATSSSADLLDRNADDVPEIERVELADVEIDGERAKVQTQLVALVEDNPTELEFETILEREEGQWRVDVRATTGQLVMSFIGEAAGEWMGQIGEIVGEQMSGMFDGLLQGLAEGMEQAGQAIREAGADSSRR